VSVSDLNYLLISKLSRAFHIRLLLGDRVSFRSY